MKSNASPPHSFTAREAAFLDAAVHDGIKIQPRFRPEPLLAKTGKGHMASAGVREIAAAKKRGGARK